MKFKETFRGLIQPKPCIASGRVEHSRLGLMFHCILLQPKLYTESSLDMFRPAFLFHHKDRWSCHLTSPMLAQLAALCNRPAAISCWWNTSTLADPPWPGQRIADLTSTVPPFRVRPVPGPQRTGPGHWVAGWLLESLEDLPIEGREWHQGTTYQP